MMINKTADISSLRNDDIKYVAIENVDANGQYKFNFTYPGNVEDYIIYVNSQGLNICDTVTKAEYTRHFIIGDLSLGINTDTRSAVLNANILNLFETDGKECELILSFYDVNGKLISVQKKEITSSHSDQSVIHTAQIPDDSVYIKGFMWERGGLMPLAESVNK